MHRLHGSLVCSTVLMPLSLPFRQWTHRSCQNPSSRVLGNSAPGWFWATAASGWAPRFSHKARTVPRAKAGAAEPRIWGWPSFSPSHTTRSDPTAELSSLPLAAGRTLSSQPTGPPPLLQPSPNAEDSPVAPQNLQSSVWAAANPFTLPPAAVRLRESRAPVPKAQARAAEGEEEQGGTYGDVHPQHEFLLAGAFPAAAAAAAGGIFLLGVHGSAPHPCTPACCSAGEGCSSPTPPAAGLLQAP